MEITIRGTKEEISGFVLDIRNQIDRTSHLEEQFKQIEGWILADRAEVLKKVSKLTD